MFTIGFADRSGEFAAHCSLQYRLFSSKYDKVSLVQISGERMPPIVEWSILKRMNIAHLAAI